MITLKKLQWDNCFSYGEGNSLDLDDATLTQLVGTNGQGKSSIPLILEEVLFNKNSKGIKTELRAVCNSFIIAFKRSPLVTLSWYDESAFR